MRRKPCLRCWGIGVRWWQVAKGNPPSWRVGHTISALSLLMLGCGAAIALSGVLHQTVWLMSDLGGYDRHWSFATTFCLALTVPTLFVISFIVPGVLLQWEMLRQGI